MLISRVHLHLFLLILQLQPVQCSQIIKYAGTKESSQVSIKYSTKIVTTLPCLVGSEDPVCDIFTMTA